MSRRRIVPPTIEKRYLTELERLVPVPDLIAFLVRQSLEENDKWYRLASMVRSDDHLPHRTLLATMAVKCGLSYVEIAAAWIREQHMNAILQSAKKVPTVLDHIADDSLNREEPCEKCDGTGLIESKTKPKDGEPPVPDPCPKCKGKGLVTVHGDHAAREQFLEVNKLIGQNKGGGVTVNVPITAPMAPQLADVMAEARRALQPQNQLPEIAAEEVDE